MAALGVFERRYVAAVCAVRSTARTRSERKGRSQSRDDAVSFVNPSRMGTTPVALDGADSHERCTIARSTCPYQHGLLVELLAQLFAVSTRYVPQTAQRLLATSELPPALERIAMRAQRSLQTWLAWTEGPRIWFLVAEMGTDPGGYCRGGAIRMFFYDEEGRFLAWGTWAVNAERRWVLCES